MKLLFPIFASLMLQSQVNTEFFGWKKCLMGFGKCKDHCTMGEKQVDTCKKKKCCVGPKVVQMIRHFIQSEMLNIFEENSQGLLKNFKNSDPVIPMKYHILSVLPKIINIDPSINTNTVIITNPTTLNFTRTDTATSTKSDSTERRDSAIAFTPPPAAPPPP
ncbi:beta-defensin 129 [Orycteropus afer afer]|uniref:Beta-defensin 129 n=1 Tax=Orycteropus afer afer TaxID=1230840 RepID=A0A8B6ZB86_ORYAF|nr:beta-defensin 129 [Orycteropus afer afer]